MKKNILFGLLFFFILLGSLMLIYTGTFLDEGLMIGSLSKIPSVLAISLVVTLVTILLISGFVRFLGKVSFVNVCLTGICIILGGFCGFLLGYPLSCLPGAVGTYGPTVAVLLFCLAWALTIQQKYEAFCDFVNRLTNGKLQISEVAARRESYVLLDTSVIIDGRIADIASTGFLPGSIVIPLFVLKELQFIADSDDAQRRQRGRRGLEILSRMQKDPKIQVKVEQFDVPNAKEVDAKLVMLGQQLGYPIVTNDYNLNKVADIQGVAILNINDLTNAVKSILLPGEQLQVSVIQEGKEPGQGVGYLEDGTMVVVENGRSCTGHNVTVTVSKIIQTTAGRMIFARHENDFGVKR